MNVREEHFQEHPGNGLLLRHLDEELSTAEALSVERHLAACEQCRRKLGDLRRIAIATDDLILSVPLSYSHAERDRLAFALAEREERTRLETGAAGSDSRRRIWTRAGWCTTAAALAASLGLIAILNPFTKHREPSKTPEIAFSRHTFEIDGEKFWPLPYSNPDLPLNAPRVVQMQVPVSSLNEVGIVVQPITSRAVTPDQAVLADILLGLDGQPLGVHIISDD